MYQTVVQLLADIQQRPANDIALKMDDFTLSYSQLSSQVRKAAKALIASEVQKGDRVAIWAPNMYEWIVAALGVHCAGAVMVPINTRWKASEAAYVLNKSQAKFLFTVVEFKLSDKQSIHYVDLLKDESIESLKEVIVFDSKSVENAISMDHFLTRADAVDDSTLDERMNSIQADDPMDMLFTSGTTGRPKGVICSHQQNLRTITTWADTVGLQSSDRYMIINPFFHSFGYKAGWMAALIKGALILPVKVFDLLTVMQQIADDKVTMLPGPPTIYQSLLSHPDRDQYDLSSLRLAVTGAAPVPVKLIQEMKAILNFEAVVTAYGLTETCGFVSICRPDDSPEVISGSSGRAMEGVEVKCVDGQGEEVPCGEPGEIWVRGYNVMQGYFDNEEATLKAITSDGWLKTGDIGVMDEQGYLDITDRLKDMYICGGFNVYPAEIENTLLMHDDIAQAAVIGIKDERMGEVGKAFLMLKPGKELTQQQVIDYCRENMSNYKVPRVVAIVDSLPMNASGKILKTNLRESS